MSTPAAAALPINEALPALKAALSASRNVLLQAPPGAGKSTIVPLELLDAPWLEGGKILMLEPRRIAARAVAMRMAWLRGQQVGATVGYRTRLDTRVGSNTRIEVVTEGILTRMLQEDSELPGVGCVIFDEFHERSLNADLGLALCIETQRNLRDELRILVMSATLDLQPLAALLGAAVISSPGRSFEVTTHYVPRRPDMHLELQISHVVRSALREHEGDILCFLPGALEIRRVQRALDEHGLEPSERVMLLYGDLDPNAQDAALAPGAADQRKIVLATSIAETSLTIEGIRIVIDAGLRRYSEFDPATGMSRLTTGKVSQAAADQRRGRAGRMSDGHCYRLWSQGAHASLNLQTPPEILHADLAPLALELACWGTLEPGELVWLDAPPKAPLAQARQLLRRLGAIDDGGRIEAHGRRLQSTGMHPRLGHMLLQSAEFGETRLACELAALMSERDFLRAPPGIRDADIRLRLAVMRGDCRDLPAAMTVDSRALAQVRRTTEQWQAAQRRNPLAQVHRNVAQPLNAGSDPYGAAGILLGWAFPDRIARRRGDTARYLLANGGGAHFGEPQALAKSEFIVAAELDAAQREARIFLAAPLSLEDLDAHFSNAMEVIEQIRWDADECAIRSTRERRIGAVVLASTELEDPDPQAMQRAALDGLRQLGVGNLPWTKTLRQWRARVELLHRFEVPSPQPWPDLSDAALTAALDQWAPPWIQGFSRREHFARMDLGNALRLFLSYAQGAILEREAPTHLTVPSGSVVPIDYLDGEVPTLSVRLQELFGLTASPRIAGGKLPLLLKLLSPAGRPVQITRDLTSFWERGYHEVKKDLKGRYPKHYWPDDPHTAQATRRARPLR